MLYIIICAVTALLVMSQLKPPAILGVYQQAGVLGLLKQVVMFVMIVVVGVVPSIGSA